MRLAERRVANRPSGGSFLSQVKIMDVIHPAFRPDRLAERRQERGASLGNLLSSPACRLTQGSHCHGEEIVKQLHLAK